MKEKLGGGGSGYAGANIVHGGNRTAYSGTGSYGTSYSGGTGGGAGVNGYRWNGWNYQEIVYQGISGEENGGSGGDGYYGGTGNPGGIGEDENGTSGTGGLLILYANKLDNRGNVTSKGTDSNGYGGASGGGSVNVFYNELIEEGTIETTGGNGKSYGGNGGDGCVTVQDINIKLPIIPEFEKTALEYPIMTKNGMVNVKYTNLDDETYYYYGLDLSVDCTALNALDKAAYDGDETTYCDPSSGKNVFYFGNIDIWPVCLKIDDNASGYISVPGGYCRVPGEGTFIQSGIFHMTYWGKTTCFSNGSFGVGIKLYEIYYDKNIE